MAITVGALAGGQAQNNVTSTTQQIIVPITLSGNYGTASSHGDTLSFAGVWGIQSNAVPLQIIVYQQPNSGTAPGNCTGIYCPGTTMNNGVISFFNAGTELTQGSAYSGATASAVWFLDVTFPAMV